MRSESVVKLGQQLVGDYITVSASVLYLFDGIITINQEVQGIWCRKWTAITWLYALSRYSGAVYSILLTVPITGVMSCKISQYSAIAIGLVQLLCYALFAAMRVYAVSNYQYFTAGIVLALNLVPVATNLFIYAITFRAEDFEVCASIPTPLAKNRDQLSLRLFARIAVVMGDVLVLAATWMKTAHVYKEARQLKLWTPYATILFRDGTVYFTAILALNLLDVLEFSIPTLSPLDVGHPFFLILPSIFVCRFILNLRQLRSTGGSLISANGDQSSRLQSFIGNIGQPLRTEAEEMDEDGDNEDPAEVGGTHFSATDRVPTRESLDTTIGMPHGMGTPGLQSLNSSGCAV